MDVVVFFLHCCSSSYACLVNAQEAGCEVGRRVRGARCEVRGTRWGVGESGCYM